MKKTLTFYSILLISAILLSSAAVYAYITIANPIEFFDFSKSDDLNDWNEKILNGKVAYWIDYDRADGFVHAQSQGACSAIYKTTKVDVTETPMLSWSWRVESFPEKAVPDVDDYPARLYVIFPSFCFSRTRFLEYVWDQGYFEETVLDGPADNIKIIVAQSGVSDGGKWVDEQRNIYEDYCMVFGEKPDKKVRAIAIMSDSDSSESSSEAMFDNIKMGYVDIDLGEYIKGGDYE